MWWALLVLGCGEDVPPEPAPPADPPEEEDPVPPEPSCGDGVVDEDEDCDDGPANSDAAACTSACAVAVCGDGLVLVGVEGCDDGDDNHDEAACTSTCAVAVCGDGFIQSGVETCEDGNDTSHDGCSPACLAPIAGPLADADLVVSGTEDQAFGYAIEATGDFDGDGIADLVVSTPYDDASVGAVFVFTGPLGSGALSVTDADARLVGSGRNTFAGGTIAVGDLNGDGFDDLAVGNSDPDVVYVVHGPIVGDVRLAQVPDKVGHADPNVDIEGPVLVFDANGDGADDLVLASPYSPAGEVFVLAGPFDGAVDLSEASARIVGERDGDRAGGDMAVGDLDGDGAPDLVLTAEYHDENGADAGAVYVVPGPMIGNISLATCARVSGEVAGDRLGTSVAAGDVNGDGVDDVIVGSYIHGGTGAAYVVHGPLAPSGTVATAAATMVGLGQGDQTGESVGSVDANGDGVDDVIVGSGDVDRSADGNDGAVYVLLGPVSGAVDLRNADLTWFGGPRDYAGGGALVGGDVNDDGFRDLLVGVRSADAAAEGSGAAYVWFGPIP